MWNSLCHIHSFCGFHDDELKEKAVEFINKFIRMIFFNGDPQRPNCFEHCNPFTGKPSLYRGVDDYQHSWVVDLIIKYVCGIRPEESAIIIDPLPFPVDRFLIDNVMVRGARLKVERKGRRFSLWLNKKLVGESKIRRPITLQS